GLAQVTVPPSPMSQTIFWALAVAVTDRPGTAAVALLGPHVVGVTAVHIHTGSPTAPTPLGVRFAEIPIAGPLRPSRLTATAASWAGVGVPPKPGGVPASTAWPTVNGPPSPPGHTLM